MRLFQKPADFAAFEAVLTDVLEIEPPRILDYMVIPVRWDWHFVVWPSQGQADEVSGFFRRLTVTHSLRWHAQHGTLGMGHVYQGRFKSRRPLWGVLPYPRSRPQKLPTE